LTNTYFIRFGDIFLPSIRKHRPTRCSRFVNAAASMAGDIAAISLVILYFRSSTVRDLFLARSPSADPKGRSTSE
jgi:hypothetical protein